MLGDALHQVVLRERRELADVVQASDVTRLDPPSSPQAPVERHLPRALHHRAEATLLHRSELVTALARGALQERAPSGYWPAPRMHLLRNTRASSAPSGRVSSTRSRTSPSLHTVDEPDQALTVGLVEAPGATHPVAAERRDARRGSWPGRAPVHMVHAELVALPPLAGSMETSPGPAHWDPGLSSTFIRAPSQRMRRRVGQRRRRSSARPGRAAAPGAPRTRAESRIAGSGRSMIGRSTRWCTSDGTDAVTCSTSPATNPDRC